MCDELTGPTGATGIGTTGAIGEAGPTGAVECFAVGTHIATPNGEHRVEEEFKSKNQGVRRGVLGFDLLISKLPREMCPLMFRPVFFLCALAATSSFVAAQTKGPSYEAFPHHGRPPAFQPGAYDVTASLELPNVQDLDAKTRKKLCLVDP